MSSHDWQQESLAPLSSSGPDDDAEISKEPTWHRPTMSTIPPGHPPSYVVSPPLLPSAEVPQSLPAKDELLSKIMEKDDEIAQLEQELEQTLKSKERLQHLLDTAPTEDSNILLTRSDDLLYPEDKSEMKYLSNAVEHITAMTKQNGERARFKIMKRLDGEELKTYSRLSDLPNWQLNLDAFFSGGCDLLKNRLKRDLQSTSETRKSLEKEYTRRWIAWRAHLIDNNALEDESDDELFNAYRQSIGKPRLRWSRADALASSRALIPKERFLRTFVDTTPLIIRADDNISNYRYLNSNNLVENPKQEEATYRLETSWRPLEEDTFVMMFKKVNKDFVKIAAHLPGRTVKDVIKYYYANKKRLGLKKYSIALKSYQQTAMEDASLALANPLAHDDPDNYGSTVNWSNRNGQRSSMRLTTKKSVNYSERALEQAALGAAGEVWQSQHPPSDEEEEDVPWSELEKERFLDAYERFQIDFRAIANFMKTKTIGQVKQFYHANRKELGLAQPPGKSPGNPKLPKSKSRTDGKQSPPKSTTKRDKPYLEKREKKETDSSYVRKPKTPKKQRAASPSSVPEFDSEPELPDYVCTWTDEQKSLFVALFSMHGRNWTAIAGMMVPLTADDVQEFYQHYREELNLDELLPEGHRRTRGVTSSRGAPFSPPPANALPRLAKSKLKKSTDLNSSQEAVDIEGTTKKRKRDEDSTAGLEPPGKLSRLISDPEAPTAELSESGQQSTLENNEAKTL